MLVCYTVNLNDTLSLGELTMTWQAVHLSLFYTVLHLYADSTL